MFVFSLSAALQLLDGVQDQSQVERFAPDSFAGLVDEAITEVGEIEKLPDLARVLDELRDLLPAIEAFTTKCFRIRLAHALAELPVPAPFRKYLAAQGTSYASDLALLHERVVDAVTRIDPGAAGQAANTVIEITQRMIALRVELLGHVLDAAGRFASTRIEMARRIARDRLIPDGDRRSWRVAALDLQLLADSPQRLAAKSFAQRVAELPVPEEEPDPEPEPIPPFKLLEID